MSKKAVLAAKAAAVLAVVGIAAVVGGGLALKKYLPPEKVRGLIVENAQKFLKRQVKLQSVDLSVLKGLTIEGFELSETPDFKAGTFAEARSFAVRLRLLPLLHKKVVVDRISADGLRVTITKGADGLFNFSDLSDAKGAAPAAVGASGAAAAGLDLDVRSLSLSDGSISYKDLKTGDRLALSEMEVALEDFNLKSEFAADVSLKAEGQMSRRPIRASLAFSGSIDPAGLDLEKIGVAMKSFRLELPEGTLKAAGKVKGTKLPAVDLTAELALKDSSPIELQAAGVLSEGTEISAQVKSPALKSDEFRKFFPAVPAGLDIPAVEAAAKFSLKGEDLSLKSLSLKTKGAAIDASGTIRKVRSSAPAPELSVAAKLEIPALKTADLAFLRSFKLKVPESVSFPAFAIDANLAFAGETLEIKAFQLKAPGTQVTASGAVKKARSANPEPELELSAKLDWPELHSADAAFLRSYGLPVPQELTFPPSQLDAQLRYDPDRADIKRFRFQTKGADVSLSGSVSRLQAKRPVASLAMTVKLDLPAVDAKDLAVLKLAKVQIPEKLAFPPSKLDAQVSISGEDVSIKRLQLRAKGAALDVSGGVRKALTAPEPDLAVKADFDLPALESADFAFVAAAPKDLRIPPSKLKAEFSLGPEEIDVKFFSFSSGANSVAAKARVAHWKTKAPNYNVTLHVPSFALEQLTQFSPETREMKLAGTGSVKLNVKGTLAKPEEFYVIADFKGVGAAVSGLALADFSGTLKGDKTRIDLPNLKGKIDDGALAVNLTVKNFTRTPSIELDGSLSRFDAGRFLAAKEALAKKAPAPPAAPAAPPAKSDGSFFNFKGWFSIGELLHSKATASDVKMTWDLFRITPDLRGLHGQAALNVGKGQFHNIADIGIVKFLSGLGILPKISNSLFSAIVGDSKINDGLMTVAKFELKSDAFLVYDTEGTIDIPTQKLKLLTTVKTGIIAPVYVNIGGTVSSPSGGLGAGRYLQKTVEKAISSPKDVQEIIKDPSKLLKGLFKPQQ